MNRPLIISVSFGFHDSNVTIAVGRRIIGSYELERFLRIKKVAATFDQVQAVVLYLLRLHQLSPDDIDILVTSAPPKRFWLPDGIKDDIVEKTSVFLGRNVRTLEIRHHFAHAAHFFLSPFNTALISTCDSGGNMEFAEFFRGDGNTITRLTQDTAGLTNTLGYHHFSWFLYQQAYCEGKLMGLAAFGTPSAELMAAVTEDYAQLCGLRHQEGQDFLESRYGAAKGKAAYAALDVADLAQAVQKAFVELRLRDFRKFIEPSDQNMLVVGGAVLNLECNTRLYEECGVEVFLTPNADDTGISLGQAAAVIAMETGQRPIVNLPFAGGFESRESHQGAFSELEQNAEIEPYHIARKLADNQLCLSHIGRAEVGPRALGHRSFLMNALSVENKAIVSERVKSRETYRPVAPLVLEEDLGLYFEGGPERSPYMLFNYRVLQSARDLLASVTHVDNTARVQTISKTDDCFLHAILSEFKSRTGHGVLINTSLNMAGEPLSDSLWNTLSIYRGVDYQRFVAIDVEQVYNPSAAFIRA